MRRVTILTSLVMGLAATAAVTGATFAMSPRPQAGAKVLASSDRMACFDPTFVDGFQNAGDNKIVVTEGRNRVYELTLGGACIGLDTTFAIGIRSRNGMTDVCGPFDADIVFRDMGGLDRRQACPILQVRHLTGDEAAKYVGPHKDKTDKK